MLYRFIVVGHGFRFTISGINAPRETLAVPEIGESYEALKSRGKGVAFIFIPGYPKDNIDVTNIVLEFGRKCFNNT